MRLVSFIEHVRKTDDSLRVHCCYIVVVKSIFIEEMIEVRLMCWINYQIELPCRMFQV